MMTHISDSELLWRLAVAFLLLLLRLARADRRQVSRRRVWAQLRQDPTDLAYLLLWSLASAVTLIAYFVGWLPPWTTFAIPTPVRLVCMVACVVPIAILRWADAALGENLSVSPVPQEQHQLVTHGPYRWVRHPIYLAGVVYFVLVGVVSANLAVLAVLAGGMMLLAVMRIPKEEKYLRLRYGQQYEQWAAQTGRFLPRFRRPACRAG